MRAWTLAASFVSLHIFALLSGCGNPPIGERRFSDAGAGGGGDQPTTSGDSPSTPGKTQGAGGAILKTVAGGKVPNPCATERAPEECVLKPSQPACGDGELNQDNEECDDHNSLPGDGCTGACKKEPYFDCPKVGERCVSTIVCGDGKVGPGEACDDANTAGGDGCSADCHKIEIGYACRNPGKPCSRVYVCGDSRVDPNEGCDDANVNKGDGCDERCRIEWGFKCEGEPSKCGATKCGDGKIEGAESCDDGNTASFDGCSDKCRAEPQCGVSGPCSSQCGDGIVFDEECDDGNHRNGDGCSSDCKLEDGFKCQNESACELVNDICTLTVPAVFRDFNSKNSTGGHVDFQPDCSGETAATGLVEKKLDKDGRPKLVSPAPDPAKSCIKSADSFAQWYRDNDFNVKIPGTIVLFDNGNGGFVNRYGAEGEQWAAWDKDSETWAANDYKTCEPDCHSCSWNSLSATTPLPGCTGEQILQDGNPLFFPLDKVKAALTDTRAEAQIPPEYHYDWKYEKEVIAGAGTHNFHFTTEVNYWFQYKTKTNATLDFTGDDDVWVFVNGNLAVDLGGLHKPVDGKVTIDAKNAASFGLEDGKVYRITVFHAERKTTCSSFRLTLQGFNSAPSDCRTNCGDGELAAGEECDDGPLNLGGYNQCSPTCTLGPRCGDGVRQEEFEACDEGPGGNDGSYGGCSATCQLGPHCGDGIVTDGEQCDDGVNDGGYGECAPGCVLGPYCGDGQIQMPIEQCDDGNPSDGDGCTTACVKEIAVPR